MDRGNTTSSISNEMTHSTQSAGRPYISTEESNSITGCFQGVI